MDYLTVNGIKKQFDAGQWPGTVAELLDALGVNAATVVAEVDSRIIRREDFDDVELRSGQTVELVKLMGGG